MMKDRRGLFIAFRLSKIVPHNEDDVNVIWVGLSGDIAAKDYEASISVVSEPRAVATGSYAQLSINTYFVSYFDPVATARGSDTIRGASHI